MSLYLLMTWASHMSGLTNALAQQRPHMQASWGFFISAESVLYKD